MRPGLSRLLQGPEGAEGAAWLWGLGTGWGWGRMATQHHQLTTASARHPGAFLPDLPQGASPLPRLGSPRCPAHPTHAGSGAHPHVCSHLRMGWRPHSPIPIPLTTAWGRGGDPKPDISIIFNLCSHPSPGRYYPGADVGTVSGKLSDAFSASGPSEGP